jgi:uncharacterized protein (TIGR01777 family)
LKVAIAGGTGMIGTWLAARLRERGDEVLLLTRQRPRGADRVQWDPGKGIHELDRLAGVHAVVNLAGEAIAARPWTRVRREKLWESRVQATAVLQRSLARLDTPPPVFVGVGGLGYYGDRGEDELDESDGPGTGFLAELAAAWEEAQLGATRELGARAAVLRLAIVLSPSGGAFPLMVRPFRIGVGGWLGHGRQFTPWLTIRDAANALVHLVDDPRCHGPFNGTVPEPTRNKDWLRALGRTLNRPVLTHAPRWALRGALGELADSLLIASTRAVPRKLVETGFSFVDPEPEAAWRWLVDEWGARGAP